ncbi:MAG: tetratricopeptide repeat protein [Planctomycetota bacterium]
MKTALPALALLPLLVPAALPAQDAPQSLHVPLLEAKSRGDYERTIQGCAEALATLCGRERLGPEQLAEAEYLLTLAHMCASKDARPQAFIALADGLAASPAVAEHPVLASWVAHLRAEHLFEAGRAGEASKVLDGLGYVRDFLVLGPLDNERGSGFRSSRAFEADPKQLDLDEAVDGKKRPVRWKQVGIGEDPMATLRLGELQRPNTQVLSYVAFAVDSDKDRVVAAGMASTGSLAVWVDGHETLRHDCQERRLGWDQDLALVPLRAGLNLVVVKVCCQSAEPAFRIRLRELGGAPLAAGVKTSADPERVKAAAALGLLERPLDSFEPQRGAEGWLAATLAHADDLPAARAGALGFQAALIALSRSAEDDAQRKDRPWCALATERLPGLAYAWYLQGFTLRQLSASQADREENARIAAYRKAVALYPQHAEAMLVLAQMEREDRKKVAAAEAWVDKALAVRPDFELALAEKLECLGDLDLDIAKEKLVLELSRREDLGGHPVLQRFFDEQARRADDPAARLAANERSLARNWSLALLLRLSRLQLQLGNRDAAAETARTALDGFPQERQAHTWIAALREADGDLDGAAAAWNQWLELCPDDEAGWVSLAGIAARQERREVEAECLERAVTLNPNLKDEQRKLEYLRADVKPFYADFTIPAKEVLAADKGAFADSAEKNDSLYWLLVHTVTRAYRDGTTSTYEHRIARVLTEEGVKELDTYRAPWSGQDQSARILTAKVVKPDGHELSARLGRGGYVDLPPMQVGDLVEIEARVDDRSRSFFGDYFGLQHYFGADEGQPVRRSVLDLVLEPGRSYHYQGVGAIPEPRVTPLEDGSELRRYELADVARFEYEPNAPSPIETGPLIRVSTYGTWDEFASWWWDLIRKQTVVTPEIHAKVQELVAGQPDLENKVRKIYEWVVTDIRYKAWEFGVHGYKPYSVASIFARRHGDCKDKAILMNAMLGEIGVKAYPILIHADPQREHDDLTLPLVQHFNHCISYVPAQQGLPEMVLDGTAEYHPIDTLPDMDRGAKVLVVEAGKGKLYDIPWTDPDSNLDRLVYKVSIQPSGDAIIEMQHAPLLNFAPGVRRRFGNEEGKRRERLSDQLGQVFGKVEIIDMDFSDLADLSQPVVYSVRFKVQDFVAREGNGFRLKSAFRPAQLSQLTTEDHRQRDILLGTPAARDIRIEYEAPEGFAWEKPGKDVKADTPFSEYELRLEQDGQKLVVHRRRGFKVQRIPAPAYPEFRKWAEEVEAAEKRPLILRPRNGSR